MSTRPDGAALTAVRQITLTVTDVSRAIAFYRDALGLTFLFSAGPTLAFLDVGGVRLMLAAQETGFTAGFGSMLYFRVADIDAAHARLAERGVAFSSVPHFLAAMPDHDLWLDEFRDPDGNPLALMCEKARAS